MNKIPFLVLSFLTMSAHAGVFDTLATYQNTLQSTPSTSGTPGSTTVTGSTPDVASSSTETQSNTVRCESQDQTSLPLAYVSSLLLEKNGHLTFSYDSDNGHLTVKSPNMISNCNSMIEWTLKQPEIKGQKSYALEAKIRKGDKCNDSTGECVYKVAKVVDGSFQQNDEVVLKPTLKGFEQCLEKAGVVVGGKVVPGAIQKDTINEKFDGLKSSGQLLFLSNGNQSKQVGPKYSKEFAYKHGCDHYEQAHPEIKMLLTSEDAERQRLNAEAEKLKNCKVEEYGKLAEFISQYSDYQAQLGDVRDRLILEAVKKAAIAIEKGTAKPADLKVIEDFDTYVVQPKIKRARELYDELGDLEGDARKVKEEELVKLLAEISALGTKPYFEKTHIQKLLDNGLFVEAKKLNTLKLNIVHHSRLGTKEQDETQTPGKVSQRVNTDKASFDELVVKLEEEYLVKTGQKKSRAAALRNDANNLRRELQSIYNDRAQALFTYQQEISPGGYCYSPIRINPNKCIQERMIVIQNIQKNLKEVTDSYTKDANALDEEAKRWEEMEAQGRRYIATQRGEAPAPEVAAPKPEPVVPEFKMPDEQRGYTFQWNGQQQQQPQYQPQQYQQQYQQMNPQQMYPQQNMYGYQQQQQQYSPYGYYGNQSYMGQQAYGMPSMYGNSGGYSFNWNGGGVGYQQPQYGGYQQPMYGGGYQQQQMPFYQQPYQAYGGYSFYGRRW